MSGVVVRPTYGGWVQVSDGGIYALLCVYVLSDDLSDPISDSVGQNQV